MAAVLWHIELSHYNEKARWALDYKGMPHVRKAPLPGLHGAYALAVTRGKQRRLPVLVLDGRPIGDSTAIIGALEHHRPDPPLYPADPGERRRALELEDYFDERLGPALRGYAWHHTIGDADATVAALVPHAGAARERAVRAILPLMRPVVRADYGATERHAERALADVRIAMDRVEAELGPSGYLVGDRFSVADLTAASLFTPVLVPPGRPYAPRGATRPVLELRAELAARPGGEWVTEMYARHRGTSAEIAA